MVSRGDFQSRPYPQPKNTFVRLRGRKNLTTKEHKGFTKEHKNSSSKYKVVRY